MKLGLQDYAALRVIERTGECADTWAVSVLLAGGFVAEQQGRLVLTYLGRSAR